MLKKLLLALVVLVVGTAGVNYLFFSADFEYRVEREMSAESSAIVTAFKDLRTWEEWSPWSKRKHPDDGVTFEYTGDPGQGMTWNWRGGKRLGDGTLAITRVTEASVDYDMRMLKPFEMGIQAGIELAPAGDKTKVTWWSKGSQDLPGVGRIMNALFAGQVKKDYADALEGLEAFVTAGR